ncbi:MAG: amidohydrolase [Rhodothermales bacterium]
MSLYLDTHQHFWKYDPVQYAWIDDTMDVIQRDFLPEDLEPVLKANGIAGCIAVQADQTEEETQFLLDLAGNHDFIKGVVGWVDLRAPDVHDRLAYFAQHPKLKGIRHIVQGESDVNFLLRDDFIRGLRALKRHKLTYDILVFPHQLGAALELVRLLPEQSFVIDHMAKPYINDQFIDGWAVLMKAIAQHDNVHCKVSGIITEANWAHWSYEDIEPYLDVVFSAFGTKRTMFGSDWPVCLVAGSYKRMLGLIQRYTDGFTEQDKTAFFGSTGAAFYDV